MSVVTLHLRRILLSPPSQTTYNYKPFYHKGENAICIAWERLKKTMLPAKFLHNLGKENDGIGEVQQSECPVHCKSKEVFLNTQRCLG